MPETNRPTPKPAKDRLVDRGRSLEQAEKIAERDFLFLVLQEKGEAQQEQRSDQDHPNHGDDVLLRFGRPAQSRAGMSAMRRCRFFWCGPARRATIRPLAVSLTVLL